MMHLIDILKEQGDCVLKNILQENSSLSEEDFLKLQKSDITPSTQIQFGHYQCNSALKLAKLLKQSPRAMATQMIHQWKRLFPENDSIIEEMEIAGPGFINIAFKNKFLADQIQTILRDPRLGVPLPKHRERIVVEFSSPNIAKELHVGHLRSTIIGDAIARLFEFLGHDVLRLNHIGDWGTQFGMLIVYMREHVPKVLTGEVSTNLTSLMQWYQASKKLFDSDPDFKKRSQLQVVKLQGSDEVSLSAWNMICQISRKAFQEIYDLLDVTLIERGESFYNPYLGQVVADLENKGMITLSEGAKCIYLQGFVGREGNPLPIIIQKSDGGYNYDTTEMAALRHRIEEEKANRIIIVTDAGQSLHFQMLFQAAIEAKYLDTHYVRVDHVPFGVVLGPDGKKFKTRSGTTEKLIDLLTEAIEHAQRILEERLTDLNPAELNQAAHVLGIDAVKYSDLSSHRIKDYVFSYDRMLRFEGNTAAFLLYAYVRIQSIKRKIGKNIIQLQKTSFILLDHPTEVLLALHLRQFGETLDLVAEDLLPHRLAEYLYELAEKFHAFFRDCRVEGSDQEESRLLLCEATGRVLSCGLSILGLKTLNKM